MAWTIIAFIVAILVIVAVHEYGHYIVGRWSGIHAEVFSIGFGPVIWSRIDKRGTRWQLAALPFGGYVRFLGDSSAASGKDGALISQLSPEERRHTMHGAPLWARAATVAAGPAFNFIFAILVFAGFFLAYGVATDRPVVGALKPMPEATQSLQPGDLILAVDGQATPDLETYVAVGEKLPHQASFDYRIERAGVETTLTGPHPFPPIADAVQPRSAAMEAGIKVGDVVTTVDGTPVVAFQQLRDMVGESGGKTLHLQIWRDGTTIEADLTPRRADLPLEAGGFETRWLIGLSGGGGMFTPEIRTPGPWETLTLAVDRVWYIVKVSLASIWSMITGAISSCNMAGPIGMAEAMGDAARGGLEMFVQTLAMFSLGIGLMNLFPIPVLDGGHLVFHVWEAVTGKPPSDGAMRILMTTGLVLLLLLMVFAVTNDLFCP
ncbi:membrane-associated zinc metalloprotease [Rhodobacter ferrooxidans]|uniref:Zinc metalloprotease n=2 Tax=Rhodobacter ferrooxidans TaxID=371731 RepID=C8S1D6_9RHOB|nr:membrane-associated zinc metalloprotease [Rhodobacter sp. SW2]